MMDKVNLQEALETLQITEEEYKILMKERMKKAARKEQERVLGSFEISLGGREYVVRDTPFTKRKGKKVLGAKECDTVNKIIASIICKDFTARLNYAEFFFLCDVTSKSFRALAKELDISNSTLTKWRKIEAETPEREFDLVASYGLKHFFHGLIFFSLSDVVKPENTEKLGNSKYQSPYAA